MNQDITTQPISTQKKKKSYQLGIAGLPQCGNISHIITNSTKPEKETMVQMIGGLKVPEDKDVILSNENFFFITLNQNYFNEFKRVLLSITKNHQIKIILFLRSQDEILESMYRQDIQDVNKKDFKFREDYLDNLDN